MSCVLRVSGCSFDVDSFLSRSSFEPLIIFRRGQRRFQSSAIPAEEESGINVSVSEREFSDLQGQVTDAIRFLSENASELTRLRSLDGVEQMALDFPIQSRDVAVQRDYFPAALLALICELQIALIVSKYPEPS